MSFSGRSKRGCSQCYFLCQVQGYTQGQHMCLITDKRSSNRALGVKKEDSG